MDAHRREVPTMTDGATGGGTGDPRPASTLVIVRDGPHGLEVLLTIRPRSMRFMGGAAVFPGGAVSSPDRDPRWEQVSTLSGTDAAALLGEEDARVALGAFVCALRESFEEVGFIIGSGTEGLARGSSLEPEAWLAACLEEGVRLATDRLVPAGRWVTPLGAPVRFDARFFIVATDHAWEPVPDPAEVESCLWVTPAEALARLAAGSLMMAPPTIEMLQRLAAHTTTDGALDALNRDGVLGAGNVISVRLSPMVHVVLAPNPGVMTGPGTNTYIVGTGPTMIIDPAVDDPTYLDAVTEAAGEVAAILVTHRHGDHVGGAAALSQRTGAPVRAFGVDTIGGVTGLPIEDEEVIEFGGARLIALHTPGHASDHLCFLLDGAASLFSGDNVLGEGTSVIAPPDGHMGDFLGSLERLSKLPLDRIYPGHFRPLDGGSHVLEGLLLHRKARGEAIAAAIKEGPRAIEEIVEVAYADTPSHLHPVAQLSALAHLEMLQERGHAVVTDGRWTWTGHG
jgi:glyoxylase-like metal-dependent hydrolase (beta-lactamase superfamily II)/8-oxo-dGTP pyrophosphatase MutT (NUDIX family)